MFHKDYKVECYRRGKKLCYNKQDVTIILNQKLRWHEIHVYEGREGVKERGGKEKEKDDALRNQKILQWTDVGAARKEIQRKDQPGH